MKIKFYIFILFTIYYNILQYTMSYNDFYLVCKKKYPEYFNVEKYVFGYDQNKNITIMEKLVTTNTNEQIFFNCDILRCVFRADKLHLILKISKINDNSYKIKKYPIGTIILDEIYYKTLEVPFYKTINKSTYTGYYVEYYYNGDISSKGNLFKGKENGHWIMYKVKGKKNYECDYIDSISHGKEIVYDEYNAIKSITFYKHGLKHGKCTEYKYNTKIEIIYDNDIIIDEIHALYNNKNIGKNKPIKKL